MLNLLRKFQREGVLPSFEAFLRVTREVCSVKGQSGPLDQRIALLETLVRESSANVRIASESRDLAECIEPGTLVVVDLTDPLLSASEANGVFQVLVEQFRALNVGGGTSGGCGKVLALDEAHKFMGGDAASDGLSSAIVDCARLMRHDGLRLIISTQSPLSLAPELLELVTIAALHRFHSRDWHTYLAKKLPLPAGSFEAITALRPGHALLFWSRALLLDDAAAAADRINAAAAAAAAGPDALTGSDHANERGGGTGNAQSVVGHVRIRRRITADRGASRANSAAAVAPTPTTTR